MRPCLFALSLLFSLATAHASEYPAFDPQKLLITQESPGGKSFSMNLSYLDQTIDELTRHAINYPPRFDTPQDRQRAIADLKNLCNVLDVLLKDHTGDKEYLLRSGLLHIMAYNLDIPGSNEKTMAIFQRLLALSPDDPLSNNHYGIFLTFSQRPKEGLPFLEKAAAGGIKEARSTMGMAYLILGDKTRALESLERYQKDNPDDNQNNILINSLRNGKIEFETKP